MRLESNNFKLLHFIFFLLISGGLVIAQGAFAQDAASQVEMESQELLELFRTAPPAPMPPWAVAYPEAESAAPHSRSIVSYDPLTGEETIMPAGASSAQTQAISIPAQSPALLRNADDGTYESAWELDFSADGMDEGVSGIPDPQACTAPTPNTLTHSAPWNSAFKLLMRFNSGGTDYYYVCSAAAISDFHLLTAGHCIYNHDPNDDGDTADARWANEVWAWAAQTDLVNPFMVSAGDEDRPYGFAKMVLLRSWTGWTSSADLNHDLAMVVLDRRDGTHTGWMGREAGVTASALNYNGYPAETPYVPSGEIRQYPGFDSGNVTSYTDFRINMCAYTYGGHSGGPVWRYDGTNRYIQGVNSTSNRVGSAAATRITSGKMTQITDSIAEDESDRPPIARPDMAEYLFTTVDDRKDLLTNTVAQGETFQVEYNAINAGFAASGTVTANFYLSTNNIISTGDIFLESRTFSLNAWTFTNPTVTLTMPVSVSPGTYYVGWILSSSVAEYGGDLLCSGSPCTNVAVIADETLTVEAGCVDDAYEEDDVCVGTFIPIGGSQDHKHCDEDWVWFNPIAGRTYRMETSNIVGDTTLALHLACGPQIAFNDDGGAGLASRLDWEATSGTPFDIRIQQFGGSYAPGEEYTITVTDITETWNLIVSKSGTGTGTVTSSPAGINCGGDCTEAYLNGTVVALTATADAGSQFVGWSGVCSGSNPTYNITMDANKVCEAQFDVDVPNWNLSVTLSGSGFGSVTSNPPGINCDGDCSEAYPDGTLVNLTATADPGSYFVGWSGSCSGSSSTYGVTMNANKTCDAQFDVGPWNLSVTKSGTGTGTVTSNPAGINCGLDCSQIYSDGTVVDLTATPNAGSVFAGWSDGCSGSAATYSVTLNDNTNCNAQFDPDVTGPYQQIYADPGSVPAQAGGPARIDVMYDVSDGDATLTGIGIRVHFDSSMLTFDAVGATLATGRFFDPALVVAEPDTSDFDGDATTDQFISMAWVDFVGAWPGSIPQSLASVHFTTAGGFTGSTQVNFSASDLAAGYSLAATPATVFEQPCTLDTDGNGSDSALTDGVLDVRYLFGFSGAQLTDGAIGPGATRPDSASIITYLDGCPAMLDVDGNGSAGALTDGVLIVRYLFGFTGAQLTDGAVGPGCTRCDAASIIAFLNTHDTTSTPASQQLASAASGWSGEQLITSRVSRSSAGRDGKTVDVQVDYMTTEMSHTGLGLRMHFDSSKLSFASLGDIYAPGALQYQVMADTLDFDGDPKTDRYINIAWVDYLGNWPGTDQTQLFTATFQTVKGKGSGATTIRYTTADVAAGMSAYLEPVDIGPGKGGNSR